MYLIKTIKRTVIQINFYKFNNIIEYYTYTILYLDFFTRNVLFNYTK